MGQVWQEYKLAHYEVDKGGVIGSGREYPTHALIRSSLAGGGVSQDLYKGWAEAAQTPLLHSARGPSRSSIRSKDSVG